MVWGAISYNGVGKLVFIDTRMNSSVYIDVLSSGYIRTLEKHGFDVQGTILQQDNDPKHFSAETMRWIKTQNIQVLQWPSCSPELNVIGHVRHYIKVRVSRVGIRPRNIDELKAIIQLIWNYVPQDYIRRLYDSIPERLNQVIKAKGGYTKY